MNWLVEDDQFYEAYELFRNAHLKPVYHIRRKFESLHLNELILYSKTIVFSAFLTSFLKVWFLKSNLYLLSRTQERFQLRCINFLEIVSSLNNDFSDYTYSSFSSLSPGNCPKL